MTYSSDLGLISTMNTDGIARAQIWTRLLNTRGSSCLEIRDELDRPIWDNCNLQVMRSGTFDAETQNRKFEFLDASRKETYLSRSLGRNACNYVISVPENGERPYWNAKRNGSVFFMNISQ